MSQVQSFSSVHLFDQIDDVMYILDSHGRFTFVNVCALCAWKKDRHQVLGKTLEEVLPQFTPDLLETFRHALKSQVRTEFEAYGPRHQAWVSTVLSPNDGGLIVQTRRLLNNAPTRDEADQDTLTGCLTRQSFLDAQRHVILPHVLAILDLNRLKAVNALRGHGGGDLHIQTVAQRVQAALPDGALMCRWGGDEFVVLVPGEDRESVQTLLEDAREQTSSPLAGVSSFSVGLAVWGKGTPRERAFALADEQLQRRKAQLDEETPGDEQGHSFVAFSQQLAALSNPYQLIRHAMNSLLELLDFDHALYMSWDEKASHIEAYAVRPGKLIPDLPLHMRVPHAGLLLTVQRTQHTAWSTDYPSEPGAIPLLVEQGVKSVIMTPVFQGGKIVATLSLRSVHRWQTITPHMVKIMELTALRLEHALELRQAVHKVRTTLQAGMQTLGIILEARDFETHGHTLRATVMATTLGEQLGLDRKHLASLREGAYLHDLGKLCIPDEILKKPGTLSPDEWSVMKTHVLQGHDLATRIPGLTPETLSVIRSHHERWDGRGYPDGLAGTEIPLPARIFAICDVYDALISERPYKQAWTHEAAIAEIERQSGQHFEPELVRAFLALHGHPSGTLGDRQSES